MNARCLAAWSAAVVTVPLISTNPVYRAIVLLVAATVTVHVARPGASLRPLGIAVAAGCAVSVVLDLLLSHSGDDVLLHVPGGVPVFGGVITVESALYGGVVALGLAACAIGVAGLMLAVEAHELIDALPVVLQRTATAMAAALNLVPGLGRSAVAVRDAQRMRGWRARGPRSWAELLVPVTVNAMEDSLTLAEAMEARGYGSGPRTRYATPRVGVRDLAVLGGAFAAVVLVIVARIAGLDDDWSPYPSPVAPSVDLLPLLGCLSLLIPVFAWPRRSSDA